MSDELGKVADFVRAGQAAQTAVDKLTGADRARLCVDAATVGSRIVRVRVAIDDAIAAAEGDVAYSTVAPLSRARAELMKLADDLRAHFERFATEERSR